MNSHTSKEKVICHSLICFVGVGMNDLHGEIMSLLVLARFWHSDRLKLAAKGF
jgi:hypothetical protein